nr:hypothetical protein [Mucilaginibacter rubeus]
MDPILGHLKRFIKNEVDHAANGGTFFGEPGEIFAIYDKHFAVLQRVNIEYGWFSGFQTFIITKPHTGNNELHRELISVLIDSVSTKTAFGHKSVTVHNVAFMKKVLFFGDLLQTDNSVELLYFRLFQSSVGQISLKNINHWLRGLQRLIAKCKYSDYLPAISVPTKRITAITGITHQRE